MFDQAVQEEKEKEENGRMLLFTPHQEQLLVHLAWSQLT